MNKKVNIDMKIDMEISAFLMFAWSDKKIEVRLCFDWKQKNPDFFFFFFGRGTQILLEIEV